MFSLTERELIKNRIANLEHLVISGDSTYTDEFELDELKHKLRYDDKLVQFMSAGICVFTRRKDRGSRVSACSG